MQKIPSLFCRNYDGDRLVRDEFVHDSLWVVDGYGDATVKLDGTACMVLGGALFKRYDRKRNRKTGEFKDAPAGWVPCEAAPNEHTGHWPGWIPVGDEPESRWHRAAFDYENGAFDDGTYEAVGLHFNGNPYKLDHDCLIRHGVPIDGQHPFPEATFEGVRAWCEDRPWAEGIVWHHQDGRMVKIKRRDFGLPWPTEEAARCGLSGTGSEDRPF